jgi:hypothetical protein
MPDFSGGRRRALIVGRRDAGPDRRAEGRLAGVPPVRENRPADGRCVVCVRVGMRASSSGIGGVVPA